MRLLSNIAADATGNLFSPNWEQRVGAVFVWGTLGGGTVSLQCSPDGGLNWFTLRQTDLTQALFTVADLYLVQLIQGTYVRAALAGSVGASGVNVELLEVKERQ